MKSTHKYQIRAASTAVRSGLAVLDGIDPAIEFSAPPEFKGRAGYWTPEHFFVAAVASCYVSTFSGMASNSNLEFSLLDIDAEGTLTEDAAGLRFAEIVLRPRLAIGNAEQRHLAHRLLHKAKENCLIGRSIACPIVMETALVIEERPLAAR